MSVRLNNLNILWLVGLFIISTAHAIKDGVKYSCIKSNAQIEQLREGLVRVFIHPAHFDFIETKLVFDNEKYPYECYLKDDVEHISYNKVINDKSKTELFTLDIESHEEVFNNYMHIVHQYTYMAPTADIYPTKIDQVNKMFAQFHQYQKPVTPEQEQKNGHSWFQARKGTEVIAPSEALQNEVYGIYWIDETNSRGELPSGFIDNTQPDRVTFKIITKMMCQQASEPVRLRLPEEETKALPAPKGNPFNIEDITADKGSNSKPAVNILAISVRNCNFASTWNISLMITLFISAIL